MKNLSSLATGLLALGFASSPALAAANRTFVSGVGSDTGTCPITTPCRTFAYALTQTASAGEIIVLSSGGYGTVTITQAVSIINTSNFAGVTVASGNGITINAGANDSVVLRGLTIDGGGAGSNGIVFNSGGKLTVDQCDVSNFVGGGGDVGNGILMQPTSGTFKIIITNTTTSNNGAVGVYYFPPSGTPTATIVLDRVSANNNGYGIFLKAATTTISNSTATGNTNYGFNFVNMTVSLDASYSTGNGYGVIANSSVLALGRSVFMNNVVGVNNNASTVNSYQDNRIFSNSTNVSGTITPVSPQ
jgi:hypothetical protein